MPNASDEQIILKALEEIPFPVGRKLLFEHLSGDESSQSIRRNRLFRLSTFGSMAYGKSEFYALLDRLIVNGLARQDPLQGKPYIKILQITEKGRRAMQDPSICQPGAEFCYSSAEITEEDRRLFTALDGFLGPYNDEQKKAIISGKKRILCVAGAGSGKTTVLTKRIEFLIKYRSVSPDRILAITFTRKARREMMDRLKKAGGMEEVMVETFNSFSEKILKKHGSLIYNKSMRVMTYRDKMLAIHKALNAIRLDMSRAISMYFTSAQMRMKTNEQLAHIFVNDCFFVRDYCRFKAKPISKIGLDRSDNRADLVHGVCSYIDSYMSKNGLRDFADQIIDTKKLFLEHPGTIPRFDHIAVDEYQDVNQSQVELIDQLAPLNLFCVGDPRQSIYGWRGSEISYITRFEERFPDSETIILTKNYRSDCNIVEAINEAISPMNLPDLVSDRKGSRDLKLLEFENEDAEHEFIVQMILQLDMPRSEIFVLARTNRQIQQLSEIMRQRGIPHVMRSDEISRTVESGPDDVTLATVHAIKGLEAETVFVTGCNGRNFPCKGSEHPVIEMIKVDEYNKEDEERRLFYVAMSRAKSRLYMTYTQSPTYFITKKLKQIIDKQKFSVSEAGALMKQLKDWRLNLAKESSKPAFVIMNDRTLTEIALKKPQCVAELIRISGIGPDKIERYGSQILRIVNGL